MRSDRRNCRQTENATSIHVFSLAFDATRAQNESVRMPGILELSVLMRHHAAATVAAATSERNRQWLSCTLHWSVLDIVYGDYSSWSRLMVHYLIF